ncbi:RNA pyrophosphohydrolase, partial [Coxiella endosymbiont of Ornithodoros amblus]|uniref:RNA pyrophosphohydrolase n=1 Tax=Coxiella endosymbiont of Ornithodoros amblus TaxID=1656166 RepID=UPI00244E2A08
DAWQFPQGGFLPNETLRKALNRELDEEVGLSPHDIIYLRETRQWISYRLPKKFCRPEHREPVCIGQWQITEKDNTISLDHCSQPEFDQWRWVDYWYPVDHVVEFKRDVYQKVLTEFVECIR